MRHDRFLRSCFLLSPEQYSFAYGRFQDGTRVIFIRRCGEEEFCMWCRGIPSPRWGLSFVWDIDPGDESPGYDLPTLRVCYGPKYCVNCTRQMPQRGMRTQPGGEIPAGDATPGIIMRTHIISPNGAAEQPTSFHTPTFLFSPVCSAAGCV